MTTASSSRVGGNVFNLLSSRPETNPTRRQNTNRSSSQNDVGWVKEQTTTFTHWINEHLKGSEHGTIVTDLHTDLADGLVLIELMKTLAPRSTSSIRYNKKPRLRLLKLENIQIALDCIKREGIQLLNIEPADIVDGNFKLTLGLLQQLVNHYPLKSVTPKNSFNKAMLAWFQAFLPEKDIPDFTTAWNDGVLLTLLIDKLKPGVLTNHSLLDSREATNLAITTAEKSFEIPQVIKVDDIVCDNPNEATMTTYLSYFCSVDSPGYQYMIDWINKTISDHTIINFSSDWLDGTALCSLVNSFLPGTIPSDDKASPLDKVSYAMESAEKHLNIPSVISPDEFLCEDTEQLYRMAYVTHFIDLKPKVAPVLSSSQSSQEVVWPMQHENQVKDDDKFNEKPQDNPFEFNIDDIINDIDFPNVTSSKVPENHRELKTSSSSSTVETAASHEITKEVNQNRQDRMRLKSEFDEIYAELDIDLIMKEIDAIGTGNDVSKHQPIRVRKKMEPKAAASVGDDKIKQPVELELDFDFSSDAGGSSSDVGSCCFSTDEHQKTQKIKADPESLDKDEDEAIVADQNHLEEKELSAAELEAFIATELNNLNESSDEFTTTTVKQENTIEQLDIETKREEELMTTEKEEFITEQQNSSKEEELTTTEKEQFITEQQNSSKEEELTTTEKEQFITEQQNSSKEDDLTTTEKEEFITEQQNSSEEDELNIDNLDEEGEEFIDVSYTIEPQSQYSTTSPEPNSDHNSSSIPSPSLSRSLSPVTLSDPPQIEAPAIAPLPRAFPEKCIAEGNGLKWGIVNKTTSFTVDCSNAGRGRLEVVIETPDGDNLEAEGQQLRSNVFKVSYVPLNVGIHKLSIMFDEQNILNSPFTCEISDPSACFVTSSDLASPTIGEEMNFQVDTRQGGPGMVQVTFNGKQQPCLFQLVSCIDGLYTYQFVAAEPGNYSIDITWAGEPIRGSPFKFLVPEPLRFYPEACQVTGVPPGRIRLGESVVLKVNTSEAGSGELKAMLVSPNNESACDISMDDDGMYIVSVIPGEVGKHHIVLQYGGEEIPQSPVMISVNNPKLIILDSSSLNHSLPVNKAIALPINTKNCGEGVLSVKFKTPNLDVDNAEVQTNHSNKHVALYVPTMVGNYTIEIYYDNNLCLPVPIEISVIDPQSVSDIVLTKTIPVMGNNYMLNKTVEFHVHAPDRDSSLLKMTAIGIKTGTSEPQPYINIVSNGNDNYTLQFRSTRSDDFKITITYNGVNLTGSPFTLPIRAPPRASKVAMFDPVIPLKSNEPIELIFDTSQAGQGALSAFAVNSKERTMPVYVEQVDDVMYRVAFIPRISDTFMVSVLFADKHINGSPFRVLYKEQKKEPPVCIHFEPEFKVKGLMGAAVYGRNSGRQEATVVQFKRGQYQISFNPSEPDIFDLRVYWFDEEIEGSPFEIDLQGMENESSESLVDSVPFALEDKIGMLAATAAGRNCGPIPVKLTTEGSDCSVYFTLQGSDSVDVNLFWNGKPFKGMPVHLAL